LVTTNSSYEALEILRRDKIDLVTQDTMRHDMDGVQFLARMKTDERLSGIPVIFITARSGETVRLRYRESGLSDDQSLVSHIRKPFGPFDLLDAVAGLLTHHDVALPRPHKLALESPAEALNADDHRIRVLAAHRLVRDGAACPVEPILAALSNDDRLVRLCAAQVLSESGDDKALTALAATMLDADEDVRKAAARAMERIEDGRTAPRRASVLNRLRGTFFGS
jgi:CheY-like chemotaxis protein